MYIVTYNVCLLVIFIQKTKTKVVFKFVNSIGIRDLKFYSYCNRHYCKVLKFPCYRIIGEFGDKGSTCIWFNLNV